MFAKAVALAAQFTRPVLISSRLASGKIETGCGSYILLNPEGWILTAGHVLGALLKQRQDGPKYDHHASARQAIESDKSLPAAKKRRKVNALEFDPQWITHVSYWWGGDNVAATTWHFDGVADLGAAKLVNYQFQPGQRFPLFGNPLVELPQGTSLCKLGFPFHTFQTQFNETSSRFLIPELPPLVRFPLDGIVTRYNVIRSDEKHAAKFVEMSTPGLRGQSGGPWFDVCGVVWGIQSRTHHLPLGFSPEVEVKGKKFTEQQFLNSGAASYINEIARFLQHHSIRFDTVKGDSSTAQINQ